MWPYEIILKSYIQALRFTAQYSTCYFDQNLAVTLWETLVASPATSVDQVNGINFFKAGITRNDPFLEGVTCKLLLEQHITKMDAATLSVPLWQIFWDVFLQVCHAL